MSLKAREDHTLGLLQRRESLGRGFLSWYFTRTELGATGESAARFGQQVRQSMNNINENVIMMLLAIITLT